MKYVRTISMEMNACFLIILRVTISTNMPSFLDDKYWFAKIVCDPLCNYSTKKTGTDDNVLVTSKVEVVHTAGHFHTILLASICMI